MSDTFGFLPFRPLDRENVKCCTSKLWLTPSRFILSASRGHDSFVHAQSGGIWSSGEDIQYSHARENSPNFPTPLKGKRSGCWGIWPRAESPLWTVFTFHLCGTLLVKSTLITVPLDGLIDWLTGFGHAFDWSVDWLIDCLINISDYRDLRFFVIRVNEIFFRYSLQPGITGKVSRFWRVTWKFSRKIGRVRFFLALRCRGRRMVEKWDDGVLSIDWSMLSFIFHGLIQYSVLFDE